MNKIFAISNSIDDYVKIRKKEFVEDIAKAYEKILSPTKPLKTSKIICSICGNIFDPKDINSLVCDHLRNEFNDGRLSEW